VRIVVGTVEVEEPFELEAPMKTRSATVPVYYCLLCSLQINKLSK